MHYFHLLVSFIVMFSGHTHVYQSKHTTHSSFLLSSTSHSLTFISTPYLSAFFAPNVYLTFPSCSLATYISTPAILPLTSYFVLSTLVPYSLPHTSLVSTTLLTTCNLAFLLSLKPESVPIPHLQNNRLHFSWLKVKN